MKNLFTLGLLLIITKTILATNYYCDPVNGNMSNSGTISSPWGSLEAVFTTGQTFNSGDIIFLMNGNHGFPKVVGNNTGNVEIKPLNGHTPTIDKIRFASYVSPASNWVLNGVTISSENTSQYAANLVDLYPLATNITVINCTITSNSNTNNWTRNDWRTKTNNGIFAKGSGHKFNYNTIKNVAIGLSMIADTSQFIGNTIQYFTIDGIRGLGNNCSYIQNTIKDNISVYYYAENHYDGFQSYSSVPSVGNGVVENVIIRQNTIINCTDNTRQFRGSMQGIGCFDGMYNNWTIENNIIIVDNWHGITLSGATNCRIVNNTIIDPYDITYQDPNDPQQFGNIGPAWIRITAHKTDGGTYSGTPSSNNIVVNNLTPTMNNDNNIGVVSNNITLGASSNYNNHFVDAFNFDVHLIGSSSAIDAGTPNNAPNVDIEGTTRPQGNTIDVGAYEYSNCNISFNLQSSSTNICTGDSVLISSNSNYPLQWSPNITENVYFQPTQTQTYVATANNGNCFHSDSVTIFVNPLPNFNLQSSSTNICTGDSVLISSNSNYPLQWSPNITENVYFQPTQTQTYVATANNGNCSHTDSITIFVNPLPSVQITDLGGSLVANYNNGTIQWFYNNAPIPNATTDTLYYTLVGDFYVTIIDNNGCENTSNTITIQTIGIKQNDLKTIKIYPNPARNFVRIETDEKIKKVNIIGVEGGNKMTFYKKNIDLTTLNIGFYIIEVILENSNKHYYLKLQKI